jgi:Tol biopolymer transport system component
MPTWLRKRRWIAIMAGLLLLTGMLSVVPITPLGRPLAAQASTVNAGDVVFSQSTGGGYPYIVDRTSGGTETDITTATSGEYDQYPDVSSDGSRVAFEHIDSHSNEGISVVNSDGSDQTALTAPDWQSDDTSEHFLDQVPIWSPNGALILFTREDSAGSYHLMVMNADGTGLTDLTPSGDSSAYDLASAWSPDGSEIAYNHFVSGHYQVWVMAANGSNPNQVSPANGCDDNQPDWSPDGTRIYVQKYCSGTTHLDYLTSTDDFADVSDTTQTDLASVAANDLRVSGDGSTVTYDNGDGRLYSVDTSSGTATEVTNGSDGYDSQPTFVKADWSMKYFAVLGDSFSSGEGVPADGFISPTDSDTCDRSTEAYAEDLNNSPDGLSLTDFRACSGATTADVILGMNGEPSQLDGITSSDNYVILTVGGDDVDFPDFASSCVDPEVGCGTDTTAYADIETAIDDYLPGDLATLFSDIAGDVSAGTRVLVVGYPNILPATDVGWPNACAGDLTTASQDAAKTVESDINSAISTAVSTYGAPFEFVDANADGSPFTGHTLCSDDGYFNDVSVPPKYSFHPNAEGQAAYAALINEYLRDNPTPP